MDIELFTVFLYGPFNIMVSWWYPLFHFLCWQFMSSFSFLSCPHLSGFFFLFCYFQRTDFYCFWFFLFDILFSNSLISAIFTIYFPLLTLDLILSSFSSFLRWKQIIDFRCFFFFNVSIQCYKILFKLCFHCISQILINLFFFIIT